MKLPPKLITGSIRKGKESEQNSSTEKEPKKTLTENKINYTL